MRKLEKKMDIMLQVCQGIAREKENGGSLKTLRKRAQCQHPNNLSGLEASALLPPDKRDVQPGHQNRFDASHYSTYLYTSGSVSCGTMNNAPIRDSAMLSAFVRTNSCFDFQAQGDDLVVNRKRPRSTLFVPPNVVFNVDLSPSACETSLEDCKSQEYMNKPPVAGTTKKKNLKWRTSSEHSIGNYPEKPCLEETVEYAPKSEPSK
ncbi:unnamed protein product [Dibothriocephalus latus]|uniref:Uncharacterized protein n=1 Tax=Dibothriocephalus latus TaxID=60516 RepID=A0A3P6SFF8_DIBLA|nr:unnamed protein product [Dibothriocephalus latus]